MICLIQYLYWEATGRELECKGEECQWYGGDTCWAKRGEEE